MRGGDVDGVVVGAKACAVWGNQETDAVFLHGCPGEFVEIGHIAVGECGGKIAVTEGAAGRGVAGKEDVNGGVVAGGVADVERLGFVGADLCGGADALGAEALAFFGDAGQGEPAGLVVWGDEDDGIRVGFGPIENERDGLIKGQ